MIKNFEEWKKALLYNYKTFMYGNDDEGEHAVKFSDLVYEADYEATEEIADIFFSLFTNDEDNEVLQSVMNQLENMNNQELFIHCLLKAFPRLASKALVWAEDFLNGIEKHENVRSLLLKKDDKIGKQSIIDYINKYIIEAKASPRELANENAMRRYLDDISRYKNLAKEIENSMR